MKKINRLVKIALILAILFAGWVALAPLLANILIIEKPLDKADAILILGGSSTYLERTAKAAEIYHQGVARKIYLTDDGTRGGWSKKEQRNPAFVELAENELIKQGVPAENIEILKPEDSGTIYEARILAETAKRENLNNVLLVTSAYHTRRTLWTFEKIFAENGLKTNFGIESPPPGIQTPKPLWWWLKSRGWEAVAGEYVKTFWYWMFY